jgi:hypothetical protein
MVFILSFQGFHIFYLVTLFYQSPLYPGITDQAVIGIHQFGFPTTYPGLPPEMAHILFGHFRTGSMVNAEPFEFSECLTILPVCL